jgi:hypothetical protein
MRAYGDASMVVSGDAAVGDDVGDALLALGAAGDNVLASSSVPTCRDS